MANFIGKNADAAKAMAEQIVAKFRAGDIDAAMASVFINYGGTRPCDTWSWANKFFMIMAGHDDARSYKSWQKVGRQVRYGETGFFILEPCKRTVTDEKTGDKFTVIYAFRATKRFGYSQTDGEPLPEMEQADRFLSELPLLDVVKAWGVELRTYNGTQSPAKGWYSPAGNAIAMGVENLATYAHELIHKADDMNGKLTERGQHWASETVAELGGAILLRCIGLDRDADLGGCWKYVSKYAADNKLDPIDACMKMLKRTCEAVALVLDTADAEATKADLAEAA